MDQKKRSWESLSRSLDQIRKSGAGSLSRHQLASLGAQYRAVVSDLSFARSQGASFELVTYLNELAGRAHGAMYAAPSPRLAGIISFVLRDFPALFRSSLNYAVVAAIIFFIGSAVGIYSVDAGLEMGEWLAPEKVDPAETSSWIMTNNIKVTILAFAAGVTAGVLTTYILFANGAMLAAVAASQTPGQRAALWTFAAPHGVIELTAIFIAGGAGLMIGSAMIAPGNVRRADAIRIAAGKALRLFAGTIPMLIVAGIIEGFISPSAIPGWSKFVFSGVTALGLILYLGFSGRHANTPII